MSFQKKRRREWVLSKSADKKYLDSKDNIHLRNGRPGYRIVQPVTPAVLDNKLVDTVQIQYFDISRTVRSGDMIRNGGVRIADIM